MMSSAYSAPLDVTTSAALTQSPTSAALTMSQQVQGMHNMLQAEEDDNNSSLFGYGLNAAGRTADLQTRLRELLAGVRSVLLCNKAA